MAGMVSLEAMSGAVSHVRREYGEQYLIRLAHGFVGGGVFEVAAGDGGRFEIVADRYGNVHRACDRNGCFAAGTHRANIGAGEYLCDKHLVAS
jgi:hypothetical protein